MSQDRYYFRCDLSGGLQGAGMGQEYLSLLQPWRDMLALGLTTWAEQPEPTRSDSHAWSAHPNYDFLTIVAGILPKTPRFPQITAPPPSGTLQHLSPPGRHPQRVEEHQDTLQRRPRKRRITLPAGVP